MKKVVLLAAVSIALVGVLWLKPRTSERAAPVPSESSGTNTSVLLFADPREAASSCGCAEVMRLARDAGASPRVTFHEFDTRRATAEAKHYEVRVSPTVIVLDAGGVEQYRFEGESREVLRELDGALKLLRESPSGEEQSGE